MRGNYYRSQWSLITGGSQGIGLSTAKELSRRGSHVIICSRNLEHLDQALREIESCRVSDSQVLKSYPLDITDYEATVETIERIINECSIPDILINCAGRALPGFIEKVDIETFREMMQLNYFGTLNVCKAVVPHMIRRKTGHIINVSSIVGLIGLFGYSGYAASKFAVVGFSEALKAELAKHSIHVSVLCPPNTRTPGLDEENRTKPAELLAVEEKVKVLDPEEVTAALLKNLPRKKFIIVPTLDGRLAYYLKRYCPLLLSPFIRRPKDGSRFD